VQVVELKVTRVAHFGTCDSTTYPMAKKRHTLEYLREKAHLRPRTNLIGCVARVRNALSYATHSFFQEQGFVYVHTPLLTASDCEGAGEMFQARTLLPSLAAYREYSWRPSDRECCGMLTSHPLISRPVSAGIMRFFCLCRRTYSRTPLPQPAGSS
jgi:hypothetical protein